jgi:hypothetical protein
MAGPHVLRPEVVVSMTVLHLTRKELGGLIGVLWEAHGIAVADQPPTSKEEAARALRMKLQGLARTESGQTVGVHLADTEQSEILRALGIARGEMSRLDFQARIGLYPEEVEGLLRRPGGTPGP